MLCRMDNTTHNICRRKRYGDRLASAPTYWRMNTVRLIVLCAVLMCGGARMAFAQQLDTHFSCSVTRNENGARVTYADTAEMRIKGEHIDAFRWESSLFRSTH